MNISHKELQALINEQIDHVLSHGKRRKSNIKARSVVNETLARVLREDKWADGTDMKYGVHVATIGGEEQEDADLAYEIYDKFSHNEMDVCDIINQYGNVPGDGDMPEVISRGCVCWGECDGKFVTYDTYTGYIDIWERP